MNKVLLIHTLWLAISCVTFQSLFKKELKSSYGYEILKHYHDAEFGNNDVKHFKGESMLFLAPWRTRGHDIALKFIKKFDYFSPCYYDLEKDFDKNSIKLKVSEEYNEDFLLKIKEKNPNISILPRVYVNGVHGDVFYLAGEDETQMALLHDHLRTVLSNPLYDGIVFTSTFVTPTSKFPWSMKDIMKHIREEVDAHQKKLFLTFEGVDNKTDRIINKKKARELMEFADKIIISNYDYPKGSSGVIPVSPLVWIQENFDFYCEVYSKAKLVPKLIMALPLYGYYVALFGKYDPLEASELIQRLNNEKQARLDWIEDYKECMISLNQMEMLFYPCLHFFHHRLRYFQEIGVGFAGFDAGTSLQIHYQLF